MTREEAIKTLKGEAWVSCQEKWIEALDMAIKALEQEPTTHGYMLVCPNCGLDVHSDFESCPRCGAKMKVGE